MAVSDGNAKEEPEKKKKRTNKLEKDDKYNTKLSGAEFFQWAKETKKNKQSVKGAGKDTEKADDSGKVDHTLGGAHDQHVGYTIYSDYVKKTYGAATKELGVKASHKEATLKVAELWRTSDERAVNLQSKRDAQSMKVETSGMSEGRPAKKRGLCPEQNIQSCGLTCVSDVFCFAGVSVLSLMLRTLATSSSSTAESQAP